MIGIHAHPCLPRERPEGTLTSMEKMVGRALGENRIRPRGLYSISESIACADGCVEIIHDAEVRHDDENAERSEF